MTDQLDTNLDRPLTEWERDQVKVLAKGLEAVGDAGRLNATLVRRAMANIAELRRITSDFRSAIRQVPPRAVSPAARVLFKQALLASDEHFPTDQMIPGYTEENSENRTKPGDTEAAVMTQEKFQERVDADSPDGPKLHVPGVDDE